MARPKRKRSGGVPLGEVREALIARRLAKAEELRSSYPEIAEIAEIYDFRPEAARLEAEAEALRAGRPITTVSHADLPREFTARFPGVWSFTVEGDEVYPTEVRRPALGLREGG